MMEENFFKINFFLTKILEFEEVNISKNSYLWYESIFLLDSIIQSSQFDYLLNKDTHESSSIQKKKTGGTEIKDLEKKYALKLKAYINKYDKYGECVLIEKKTLEFKVINDYSRLTKQLILVRGFSPADITYKNKQFNLFLKTCDQLFKHG